MLACNIERTHEQSNVINMGTEIIKTEVDISSPDYLTSLLRDKKQVQSLPNVFVHMERLLDDEINRVRISLFHNKPENRPMSLPDAAGPTVTLTEKVWVPTQQFPEFNFVGRILGPRGMTLKDLENQTGCKIMVRGKGSMREKQKEDANRGKPSWEHLNENLHVLISVEDTRNRAELKIQAAVKEINKLLVPAREGEDDLKKRQLMELAIINGTYRDTNQPGGGTVPTSAATSTSQAQRMLASPGCIGGMPTQLSIPHMRSPAGQPIILAPRFPMPQLNGLNGGLSLAPPPLISPTDPSCLSGLMFNPYDLSYASTLQTSLLEYPPGLDPTSAGAIHKLRRTLVAGGVREHPYTRIMPVPGMTQ